jgi:methionyl-tRNA formyltransferase
MNIVFAGTPEFACQSLRSLIEFGLVPQAVLTQPDRPAGRGKKLTSSPVKTCALAQNIPVWQPKTLKDPEIVAELENLNADLMIVAAYGLLLPQNVLDLPRLGCLNVHASLLPRWRGAAPIQAAILAGDERTGISLMKMESGLDTGPVYVREAIAIGASENAGELHDRLAMLGGEMLTRHLQPIERGELRAEQQDEDEATYAGKIRSGDALLDWQLTATQLHRSVRAYNPVPGAWFELDGERVKCWSAALRDGRSETPGTVLSAGSEGIDVCCGEGVLRLLQLQRPGRNRVSAAEFSAQLELAGRTLG